MRAVVDVRAGGKPVLGVLVTDRVLDRIAVALVSVGLVELVELIVELVVEIVDVAHVCYK